MTRPIRRFRTATPWQSVPTPTGSNNSGTAKTVAAGIISNELALPIFRIDLASVVSKRIGETGTRPGQPR
jgi:AAA+ superfamily predicted ATPase